MRHLAGLMAALSLGIACTTTTYRGPLLTRVELDRMRAENPGRKLTVEVSPRQPEQLVDVTPGHATLALTPQVAARVVPADQIQRVVVVRRGAAAGAGA